jgi:hypothetical protein
VSGTIDGTPRQNSDGELTAVGDGNELDGRTCGASILHRICFGRQTSKDVYAPTVLRCVEVVAWCDTAKSIVGAEETRVRPRAE